MPDGSYVNGAYPSVVVKDSHPIISAACRNIDRRKQSISRPGLFFCEDANCRLPAKPIFLTSGPKTGTTAGDIRYTAVVLTRDRRDVSTVYFDAEAESAFVATVANVNLTDLEKISIVEVDGEIGPVYGEFPHITIDAHGNAAFAYYRQVSGNRGDLMLVDCQDHTCSHFARSKIAQGRCGFGRDTALAFDHEANYLYISFMDYSPKSSGRAAMLAILRQSDTNAANRFSDIC
mmetsp:Transcript_10894/g.30851  ORF Transcript_10894/g.30851 Transcript_10894/m.30851 type:complete len:233 (-) Transcript_10894:302-1000(-)